MSVIERNEPTNGKGPACDCGSTAVIDANRHAWDCTRRLWVERNDARQQLQGAVNLLREARALFQEDGTENGVDRRFIEGFENLGAAIRLLEGGQ